MSSNITNTGREFERTSFPLSVRQLFHGCTCKNVVDLRSSPSRVVAQMQEHVKGPLSFETRSCEQHVTKLLIIK